MKIDFISNDKYLIEEFKFSQSEFDELAKMITENTDAIEILGTSQSEIYDLHFGYGLFILLIYKTSKNEYFRIIFNGESDFWPVKWSEIRKTEVNIVGGFTLMKIDAYKSIELAFDVEMLNYL